jgi:hypothetical protein
MNILRNRTLVYAILVFLAAGAYAWAQDGQEVKEVIKKEVKVDAQSGAVWVTSQSGSTLPHQSTYTFIGTEAGFEAKTVKGFPFTANGVTEFIQVLGNGQRIYRKSTSTIFRDFEGRTRREQTIDAIGPYASSGHAHQTITIADPVAGVTYVLNPADRTAVKTSVITHSSGESGATTASLATLGSGESGAKTVTVFATSAGGSEVKVVEGTSGGVAGGLVHVGEAGKTVSKSTGVVVAGGGGSSALYISEGSSNAKTESLGTQVIEGVQAEGTRTVVTIPAGSIGNDSPIEIISEKWYSPELGMVVRSKNSDPRSGDNIYQLTNIRREEPSASLFQVPADYTIKEGGSIKIQTIKKDGNQ